MRVNDTFPSRSSCGNNGVIFLQVILGLVLGSVCVLLFVAFAHFLITSCRSMCSSWTSYNLELARQRQREILAMVEAADRAAR